MLGNQSCLRNAAVPLFLLACMLGTPERPSAAQEPAAQESAVSAGYGIPLIDLAHETERQIIVDREPGQYLGHPTTVLLEDNKTMICVYPKGHGRGSIVMKRSTDAGLTWSDRLPTPDSWATSKEVPTIHRVVDADGNKRLILWSGLHPARLSVSEDDGQTWTELEPVGDWGGIVVMGSVIELKTGPGHYMALFHDDGRFIGPNYPHHGEKKFYVYKSISTDGGLTWSAPVVIATHPEAHLCEPGAIRSPDGHQIAVLLRENSRQLNSFVIFTNDEGETWSEPRQLPASLTGDRHTGRYAPDGRLFISFRDTTRASATRGDWVAWVGTYDDIVLGREGQYRVRLMDNHRNLDCAYPGVEILPDGTLITTTYGTWTPMEQPYIASVRLKLEELDRRVEPLHHAPPRGEYRWWKGNLHTHTFWSDGNDFPEMTAQWYRRRGYNFLALSDHNVLSQGQRWVAEETLKQRGGDDVVQKYRDRFGDDWVEERTVPESEKVEIRLKPLGEFRSLVEVSDQFIMIQSEEISDSVKGRPVHMNAANLLEPVRPVGGETVREAIANNLRAVQEQADRLGQEILLHLNHPNFGYAVTAEDLAHVVQEQFFEVYNGHHDVNHLGDDSHPSVEKIWDLANTIRLGYLNAAPLYGLGTDDTHHYHGRGGSRPGRGWVMVRSRYLTPESLILAMRRGEFYASSGVVIDEVNYDPDMRTLSLQIGGDPTVNYVTEFIGTPYSVVASLDHDVPSTGEAAEHTDEKSDEESDEKPDDTSDEKPDEPREADPRIGMVLARVEGTSPSYQLTGDELYVRAVVTSSKPHRDPSFEGQQEQAWTQPVGWALKQQDSN